MRKLYLFLVASLFFSTLATAQSNSTTASGLLKDGSWVYLYSTHGTYSGWHVAMGIESKSISSERTALDGYDARGVANSEAGKVMRLDKKASSDAYYLYCNGYYYGDAVNGQNIPLVTDKSKATAYVFTPTGNTGCYNLRPEGSSDENTYINDVEVNYEGWMRGGPKNNDVSEWRIASANDANKYADKDGYKEEIKITLNTVGDYSYATTCMPFPIMVSASDFSVKTYIGVNRHDNMLTLKEVTGTIPAETPIVIIASTKGKTPTSKTGQYEVTVTLDTQTTPTDVSGNLLSGAITPTETGKDDLTFGVNNDVVGFYKDSQRFLHANRAYIKATTTTAAKAGLRLYWNNTPTTIKTVGTDDAQGNRLSYNLQGQPVSDSYKGIVIEKGKKYIQK